MLGLDAQNTTYALGLAAAFAVLGGLCAAPPTAQPNILLMYVDNVGYGDLGCYGARSIRTPRIDELASNGLRLTNFLVSQPVCTASRAALMTGCYSNRVGLFGALNHTSTIGISAKEPLLPQLFKQRGYATACYGKWHLGHGEGAPAPQAYGFDVSKVVNGSGEQLGDEGKDQYFRAKSTTMIVGLVDAPIA